MAVQESTFCSEGPKALLVHADDSVFATCALDAGVPEEPRDLGSSHRVLGNPNPNDCDLSAKPAAKDLVAGSNIAGLPSRPPLPSPEPALAARSAPMQTGSSAPAAPAQQKLCVPRVPAPSVAHSKVAQESICLSEGPQALLAPGCDRVFAACALEASAPEAPRDVCSSHSALGKSIFDDEVRSAKPSAIGFETGSARAGSLSGRPPLSQEPASTVKPALMQTGYSVTAAPTQQQFCASLVFAASDAHASVAPESTCRPARPMASLLNGGDHMRVAQALESNTLEAPRDESGLCSARGVAEESRMEVDAPAPKPAGEEDSWMEALLLT